MKKWSYCEFVDGSPVLTDITHESANGMSSRTSSSEAGGVLLSRLDVLFVVLDIPKIRENELRNVIGYKLRGVYPGNPERTSFDFTVPRNGKTAAVTVLGTDRLDRIRKAAGERQLFLPWHILRGHKLFSGGGRKRILFAGPGWIEFLLLDGPDPVESKTALRTGLDGDREKMVNFLTGDGFTGDMYCIAAGNELAVLKERLTEGPAGESPIRFVRLETLLEAGSALRFPLFGAGKRIRIPPFGIRMLILLALLSASILLRLSGSVTGLNAEAGELAARFAALEKRLRDTVELEREIETIEKTLASYEKTALPETYGFFQELRQAFGEGVVITSLSVRERTFRCEGRAVNPFALVDRFEAAGGVFSGINIARVSPLQGTEEESFILSGTYDGR